MEDSRMAARWLFDIGLGAGLVSLLLWTQSSLHAADPTPPVYRSHTAPAAGVSETASFSPPSMAASLGRPVPQANVSGTTSGNRPLAVTLGTPIGVADAPAKPLVATVGYQAAAPGTVPLSPAPGAPQRMPNSTTPRV